MSTLNEVSYNILNTLSANRTTETDYLSVEQIAFAVLYYRALLIRRYVNNNRAIYPFQQDIGELTLTDNGAFFESDNELPNLVRLQGRKNAIQVTFNDGTDDIAVPVVSENEIKWIKHSKFTPNEKRAFMRNNKLYVYDEDDTSSDITVRVRGVFEDPLEAHNYNISSGYRDRNDELPATPADLIQNITQSMVGGEFSITPDIDNAMDQKNE